MKVSVVVFAALVCSCAAAIDRRAPQTPQPRADEWGQPEIALTVSGWVGPPNWLIFALYSSGRVLYVAPGDTRGDSYRVVTLTDTERNALIGDLPLNRVGHVQLPKRVGDDGATDCIHVWSNGGGQNCLWGGFENEVGSKDSPPELGTIWKRLAHFASPHATPWVPDHIEVVAEPWGWRQPEEKCGKPLAFPWPKKWPKPGGTGTVMPTRGWRFSVPPAELPELRRIEAAHTPSGCAQPVALRGEYYALSYSAPLPHEEAWWRD